MIMRIDRKVTASDDSMIVYSPSLSFANRESSQAIRFCDRMMVLWFASI
jgi:hypothetical protein